MTEHDARIMAPKSKAVKSRTTLGEFADAHYWCMACGRDGPATIHHIIGGRGGRSDELCNLLYLCWSPCHQLAESENIQDPSDDGLLRDRDGKVVGMVAFQRYLPKITLGIALSMKLRCGELDAAGLSRLAVLNGCSLPDPEQIPEWFQTQYARRMREREGS